MKHESGTETVGRRKTLNSGTLFSASVLIWCSVSNNEDEVSVPSNALPHSMLLPSSPSSSFPRTLFPSSTGQLEVILDRRLMQDDNRGLGQGLKDNKRTANRFRLLLERRSGSGKVSSDWIRGYKWTKPDSDSGLVHAYSDYLDEKRQTNM